MVYNGTIPYQRPADWRFSSSYAKVSEQRCVRKRKAYTRVRGSLPLALKARALLHQGSLWKKTRETGKSDRLWERNWVMHERGAKLPASHPLITREFCNAYVYWPVKRKSNGFIFKKNNYPNMLIRPNTYHICDSVLIGLT